MVGGCGLSMSKIWKSTEKEMSSVCSWVYFIKSVNVDE